MSFGEAVGACLRKFSDFSGRSRRSEFWWFVLAETLLSIPVQIWAFVATWPAWKDLRDLDTRDWVSLKEIFDAVDWPQIGGVTLVLFAVFLLFAIPMLAAGSRRLHDMGQSGWWQVLLVMGPLAFAVYVMWVLDSQPHENRYGPDPKADERVPWGREP